MDTIEQNTEQCQKQAKNPSNCPPDLKIVKTKRDWCEEEIKECHDNIFAIVRTIKNIINSEDIDDFSDIVIKGLANCAHHEYQRIWDNEDELRKLGPRKATA